MNLKTFKTVFALAAASYFGAASLEAQEAGMRAKIRMLAFSPELGMSEAFAQDPAAPDAVSVPAPVKTYLNHEFSTIPLRSRKVSFTRKPDRASLTRDGELIGEVTLPTGVDSAILLFLPGTPGGKASCQILPIADTKRAFPTGSFSATNLSPLPVRLTLEGKNYDVRSGQNLLIEDPPTREGGMIGMRAFAYDKNIWNPIGTGLWPHPGKSRGVLVMFMNLEAQRVQLRAFDDVPPGEVVAAPPSP